MLLLLIVVAAAAARSLFIVKCKIHSHTQRTLSTHQPFFQRQQQQRRIFSPAPNNNKLPPPPLSAKRQGEFRESCCLPLAFYAHYFRTWIAAVAYGDELGRN
jgi:hypothetical protein